ncbi:MAG: IS256 family transposase [Saprospiraceae bacterium]|nr:IS256 family transposase [Saprospiraceae bacterium]
MTRTKHNIQPNQPPLFDEALLSELAKSCKTQEDIFGQHGLIKSLTKALLERVLNAEMTQHLGYDKHDPQGYHSGNSRNGTYAKTVTGNQGDIALNIPRDRNGSYEPALIKKHQTRIDGFDEKIIAMYARGATLQDIQAQLKELYGVEVSPEFISNVTDAVIDEVRAWQNRPLDALYTIVYLDALVVKVREGRQIVNKSVYIALGVNTDGHKEVLGLWIHKQEGSKFWLSVLTELRNRGTQDILIACVDGLNGFPEAIEGVFPNTQVQLCIVHCVRNSMKYVSYKDRRAICADLKKIYQAPNIEAGEQALAECRMRWDRQYPMVGQQWQNHWAHISPLFNYTPEIRKAIYTTNAVESLNMCLRKVIKNKRVFPSDDAVFKQMYLAINNIEKRWTMPIREWSTAVHFFSIAFPGRI